MLPEIHAHVCIADMTAMFIPMETSTDSDVTSAFSKNADFDNPFDIFSIVFNSNPSQSTVDVTSSSPSSTPSVLTFQICILVIATVGLLANASVLAILAADRVARKKTSNLLIMNQLTLDMMSCALLVVSHSVQLGSGGYLSGEWGLVECFLFMSEFVPFVALMGSIASLVIITVERYDILVGL